MNSKMITNSQISTTEPKKKKAKINYANNQDRKRITEIEITWRVISGGLGGGNGEKGTENKQHTLQVENRQGEVKNSIGNVEAKELICMTYGHEPRGGECWWVGQGVTGKRSIQGRKKLGQL